MRAFAGGHELAAFETDSIAGNESPVRMRYRRTLVAGATYFFTLNLADRRCCLLVDHIEALREAVRDVKQAHPFQIVAWVVLPEHMHAIWSLPPGDSDYSLRWNQIKGAFSRRIPSGEAVSPSRARKRERGIWQRRFWEHLIRDDLDLVRHVDYVHYILSSTVTSSVRPIGRFRHSIAMSVGSCFLWIGDAVVFSTASLASGVSGLLGLLRRPNLPVSQLRTKRSSSRDRNSLRPSSTAMTST